MRNRNVLFAVIAVLAFGLIAAGCGGDDETTTDGGAAEATTGDGVTVPTDAQEALDEAPENIDEAVQRCLDSADDSGLSDEQIDSLKQLCESGGDAANQALEDAQGSGSG